MPHLYPVVIASGRSVSGLSLGFHAYSLRIDNCSNQWLQEESSLAWIPPYSLGTCLRLYGTAVAIIVNQAPIGQPQLAPIAGEYASGFFSDELRTEVAGTPIRQFTFVQAVSDLTQGPEPALPPVGVDRLWADTGGSIHHLHTDGTDLVLVDPSQIGVVTSGMIADGTIVGADIANAAIGAIKLAAGAAAGNVGALGGALAGTLPNPTLASSAVDAPSIVPGAVSKLVYDGSVAGDQWNNAAFAAGDNSIPAHPVLVSGLDTDASFFVVHLQVNAQIVAPQTAGLVAGWDFFFQNALWAKLTRVAYVGNNIMVSATASVVVNTVGSSAYQFGLKFYASTSGTTGLYLLCSSAPSSYYARMQIIEVRR